MTATVARLVFLTVAMMALSACKAEKIEVDLNSDLVIAASTGIVGDAGFEATVGEQYTTVDDEKRALIENVRSKIEKYFPEADIEVDIGADEYEIQVEGRLVVAMNGASSGAPWYVYAAKATDGDGILVQLLPSESFKSFNSEIQDVNSMLAADEVQPVEFRFTAPSGTVIVGGAIIDGKAVGVTRIPMNGQTIKMLFKEGVWEQTSGSFLFVP